MAQGWKRAARFSIAIVPALLVFWHSQALAGETYQHQRPIEGAAAFTRLEVPDDVLDACRSGLADLRIVKSGGEEVPYALGALPEPRLRWPLRNVERVPNVETTAVVDRGERPVDIDGITLVVEGTDFLKPIIVEASTDLAHWKELTHASVFATAGASMTRISFATSDRRYLRLRLDDKSSDPVTVSAVVGQAAASSRSAPREIAITPSSASDAAPGAQTLAAEMPASHLAVVGLRLESAVPAFARDVHVYDRIVYRGEVSRRLVGAAHLFRGAEGAPNVVVPIAGPVGRTLEVEVSFAAGRPLAVTSLVALVAPTFIVFHAPSGDGLTLRYGSATARRPVYDLAEALGHGAPHDLAEARLGPDLGATADGGDTEPVMTGRFAATLDPAPWRVRRPITPPPATLLAFVAVDDRAEHIPSLRIVDEGGRQLPYLLERESRLLLMPISFAEAPGPANGANALRIGGIDPTRAIDALELDAKDAFFEREVTVEEAAPRRRERSDRGGVLRRRLGGAHWVRRPDESSPLRVPIAQPDEDEIFVVFQNGAERPLTIERISLERVERRLDFLLAPAQSLTLLSDNPAVSSPQYDLALVADRMADLPAAAAQVGAAEVSAAPRETAGSRWLWAAVLVAALGVTGTLVRTLRPAERK